MCPPNQTFYKLQGEEIPPPRLYEIVIVTTFTYTEQRTEKGNWRGRGRGRGSG